MDLSSVTSYRTATEPAALALAPGEAYLGGGTWLFSEPQPALTGLVDLAGLGWPPVEALPDGGVRIAATCTVERLRAHDWPPSLAALAVACADALLMSWKVQHAATVGGNLCLALPAGAMVALAAALDGDVVLWDAAGGERREPVLDFVRGAGATTLRPGDLIRGVDVPASSVEARYACGRIALTTYGRTGALVIGRRDEDGLALTVTGSTPRPVRLTLAAGATEAEVRSAVAQVPEWYDDPHGAPDWRAAVTAELAVGVVGELVGDLAGDLGAEPSR
jgi:CO/xanthine dehydrogenase FAD-binding subunit